MKPVIIIAIAFVLLIPLSVFGQMIPTTDELLNKAFALNKEGKYEDSLPILNKVIENEPDNITALYYRSSAHIGLEQFQNAKDDLDRIFVLRLEPSGGILYNYAVALAGIGKLEESLQYFELIDETDHNYINALNKKGIVLLDLSRFEESVESFDLVIKNDPDNVKAHLFRGVSLLNMDEYDESLKSINTALSLDPQNVRAKEALQSSLKQKGQSLLYDDSNLEEAKVFFEQALVNNPEDVNAAALLSIVESEIAGKQISQALPSIYITLGLALLGIIVSYILYKKTSKQIKKLDSKLSQ